MEWHPAIELPPQSGFYWLAYRRGSLSVPCEVEPGRLIANKHPHKTPMRDYYVDSSGFTFRQLVEMKFLFWWMGPLDLPRQK